MNIREYNQNPYEHRLPSELLFGYAFLKWNNNDDVQDQNYKDVNFLSLLPVS